MNILQPTNYHLFLTIESLGRIHGLVRFDLNHACEPFRQSQPLYRTCIAVGNYPVDHHHTRYHGYEELPNLYFYPIPSYGLPFLGTLIPKDVEGLIVAEKSISVSNIINGTTRLQPMVMQIGQAAGALAALAVKEGKKYKRSICSGSTKCDFGWKRIFIALFRC